MDEFLALQWRVVGRKILSEKSFDLLEMPEYLIFSNMTTVQKMKFSIRDFFSKCEQIRSWFGHIYRRNR